jgi:hypothetical protein
MEPFVSQLISNFSFRYAAVLIVYMVYVGCGLYLTLLYRSNTVYQQQLKTEKNVTNLRYIGLYTVCKEIIL